MAIDRHDSQIRHSLYGRKLGLDNNDLLTGLPDVRVATETVTAASTLMKGGTSLLSATAATVYELPPPSADLIGVRKRLINGSTGLSQLVKLTAGNYLQSALSTNNTLTIATRGASIDLEYITTALVSVIGASQSTAVMSFSTTT